MSYLDIAYDLNKLEQLSYTYEMKQLIKEVRYEALSNEDVDWKDYFLKLVVGIEPLLEERYKDGYSDAKKEYLDD